MNVFYNQIAVQLGKYVFHKGIAFTACSDAGSASDWAAIRFTSALGDAVTLKKLEPARLFVGANNMFEKVFDGILTTDFQSGSGSVMELRARDAAIRLAATKINQVFVDAVPQEIVRTCCRAAGIKELAVDDTAYASKTYPAINISALEAIRGIAHHWGINSVGYMQDDTFRWNKPPDQTSIYLFEYGKNIVSLSKEMGMWALITVAVPAMRHSVKIAVNHPRLSGKFMVQKVLFTCADAGFIRTKIFFRE